jgi:hypothetical protein
MTPSLIFFAGVGVFVLIGLFVWAYRALSWPTEPVHRVPRGPQAPMPTSGHGLGVGGMGGLGDGGGGCGDGGGGGC